MVPASHASSLLLEISHCPVVGRCLSGDGTNHPCSKIVRSQTVRSLSEFQVPEPWTGKIDSAPILFLSSNPSISHTEEYPRVDWPNDDIVDFFVNGFGGGRKEWIVDGQSLNSDGSYGKKVYFWSAVKRRAEELLDRDAIPGHDYVLSEVVHCKSLKEQGVEEALLPCADLYLERVIGLSVASIVICVGVRAAEAVHRCFGVERGQPLYGPIVIGQRKRFIAFLPHPSSFEKGKTLRTRLSEEEFVHLQRIAQSR
jgi:hypothetical protein